MDIASTTEALLEGSDQVYRFIAPRMASLICIAGFKPSGIRNPRTRAPVVLRPGMRKATSADPCLAEIAFSSQFVSTKAVGKDGKKKVNSHLSGAAGYFRESESWIAAEKVPQPGARQLVLGHTTTFVDMSPFSLLVEALTDDYDGRSVFIQFVKKTNVMANMRLASNGSRLHIVSADQAECFVVDKRVVRSAFAAIKSLDVPRRRALFDYAVLDQHPLFNAYPSVDEYEKLKAIEAKFPDIRLHLRHLPRFDGAEFACLKKVFSQLTVVEPAGSRPRGPYC